MSLKVSIDKVGRTVEKDRKKNSKVSSIFLPHFLFPLPYLIS